MSQAGREPIGVGLYGINGHQVCGHFPGSMHSRLVAVADVPPARVDESIRGDVAFVESLDDLLARDDVELVSLCSPRRIDQVGDTLRCLEAGRAVLAEKPCAFTEEQLDEILETSRRTGCAFREMANGLAEEKGFRPVRQVVESGRLGTIVQVLAHKSYPLHEDRPQDEETDGGLLLWVGGHAVRMIEQIAGLKVEHVEAMETTLGNPVPDGQMRMACQLLMRLEGGALGVAVANYLKPPAFEPWGNDQIRIYGTEGMVEAVDGLTRTRLVLNDRDCGPLEPAEGIDYFESYVEYLRAGTPMLRTVEDEVHATRVCIRAKALCGGA